MFYREAGSASAPALLMLHGFPASSFQYRNMLPLLGERWHAIAPDLPGFGFSDVPSHRDFSYSFDHLATTVDSFLKALEIRPRALYLHDYGAQVGFRLLTGNVVRPAAVVIQNSEAHYSEGRTDAWQNAERYWKDPSESNRDAVRQSILSEEGLKREFVEALPPELVERIDPVLIRLALDQVRRPGVVEAMLDLHRDYRNNVAHYDRIQRYLREQKPSTLVLWGKHDQYYGPEAAYAYRNELPDAQIRVLESGGHWICETDSAIVAELTLGFLDPFAR